MKSIVIASNKSGGGKTTITLGIMRALIKRGFKVQGYKIGPDYIDPAFHKHITRTASRNLDLHLMGEAGVKASYSRGNGDFGVVEGVMGLYDGKGISTEGSTAAVAKVLNLPIILIISPKAQSITLCAEINGLLAFEKTNVVGVILNNVNESYYKLLKAAIEKHCSSKIKVFGYVPKEESLKLKSRHLGLVQSSEVEDLDNKIEKCSELIEKYVNMKELMEVFNETESFEDGFHLKNIGLKTAVAKDEAFNFYYEENIELLKELGEVKFFSPLRDETLPEGINYIYIGGGYPEVFKEKLSSNVTMLNSIKKHLKNGLRAYAECGGLMYLMEEIEGKKMVGFFKGKAEMTKRLQNFGYAEIEIAKDNRILPKGMKISCHEFHKSLIKSEEKKVYLVKKETYEGEIKTWKCGYVKGNALGAYAHIHFFSNLEFLKSMVSKI